MINRFKHSWSQIVCTILTVVLLCTVIIVMIGNVYELSENEAFEKLHLETSQIKSNINLQIYSDRENLITISNFASKLYLDGENFDLLFQSFERIGLIENIGILTPDNRFQTKVGLLNVGGVLSFDEEIKKENYISGRVKDLTNPGREVVRMSVPIKVNGNTVAILYGIIELETFMEKYSEEVTKLQADLFVIEGGNGNFIIDTKHTGLGNITTLSDMPYKKGFSYNKMIGDLSQGVSGYSSYLSQKSKAYVYAHYAPLEFGDWQIMLSRPESIVFAGARSTGKFLIIMFFAVLVIMLFYLIFTVTSSKKKAKVNLFASAIRKQLLKLNTQYDVIHEALKNITAFSKSRSSFFVDTYGEDYNFVAPHFINNLLTGEQRSYFVKKLMGYISRHKKEYGVTVQLIKIVSNKKFQNEMPEFYEFLKKHEIHCVCFAGVVDNTNNTSLVGVINPKNNLVEMLLKDIAVCFSMAVYNKKHLVKTEAMALTDSLTGVSNRMAYKQNVKKMNSQRPKMLACIYIDVNELHYFNNKYGHAAGDQMLVHIAEVLTEQFEDCCVYRMGGDEFLIFAQNISKQIIDERLEIAKSQIEEMKYHISVGVKFIDEDTEIEELVNEAEKEMYDDKAKYYQDKQTAKNTGANNNSIETISTGIKEVDACLSVIGNHYQGMYSVNIKKDMWTQILAPSSYFKESNGDFAFSDIMKQYIHDTIRPEFHRMLLDCLKYDVLERQLKNGYNPKISYTKVDGEKIKLCVYAVSNDKNDVSDTIWVFEKDNI